MVPRKVNGEMLKDARLSTVTYQAFSTGEKVDRVRWGDAVRYRPQGLKS